MPSRSIAADRSRAQGSVTIRSTVASASARTVLVIGLDGTDYLPLSDLLTGPVGIATSIDPVAAAKVAVDFAKTNDKFEIVGGSMGDVVLDVNGVKALAELPSLDELRAKLVGLVQAPATKLAQLSTAPAAKLARVFAAYAEIGRAHV